MNGYKYTGDEIGVEYDSLKWYRYVSARFEKVIRITFSLSWSHFQQVASRSDRLEWLHRAEK